MSPTQVRTISEYGVWIVVTCAGHFEPCAIGKRHKLLEHLYDVVAHAGPLSRGIISSKQIIGLSNSAIQMAHGQCNKLTKRDTLDLLGPYPASQVRRNRYVLVTTDHFSKWLEIKPIKKASAKVISDSLFDNYISRYGAAIKMISDNGLKFISEIFEHLCNRLDIQHVNIVVYRPQSNSTERVNRDLVQMIASYVDDDHETWDQFLREFIRMQ
ncbi:retrovirus-related Pol polyprotein from transposon 17.6 [Trichonephila clavipes]|nr:retrovirus-related Pol polyprotein from transposon 17.6 [Trichonephila clavipes]